MSWPKAKKDKKNYTVRREKARAAVIKLPRTLAIEICIANQQH